MNPQDPDYNPDDAKPINYWLYLVGLIVYIGGIYGIFVGINLNNLDNHADGTLINLTGKLLISFGIGCSYCLLVMIIHFIHRYKMSHQKGY